jgi:hypothetical protein
MKRNAFRVLVVLLSVLLFGLLAACGAGASSIERIVVGSQKSNDVDMKNYQIFLKDTVDWAALSDQDRARIAVAGFEEAQKKIAEDGIHNYNITGIAADSTAFQYNGADKVMVIYLDNEQVATVEVTVPEE